MADDHVVQIYELMERLPGEQRAEVLHSLNPPRANLTAGASASFRLSLPWRAKSFSHPLREPGTADDAPPTMERTPAPYLRIIVCGLPPAPKAEAGSPLPGIAS